MERNGLGGFETQGRWGLVDKERIGLLGKGMWESSKSEDKERKTSLGNAEAGKEGQGAGRRKGSQSSWGRRRDSLYRWSSHVESGPRQDGVWLAKRNGLDGGGGSLADAIAGGVKLSRWWTGRDARASGGSRDGG